MNRTVNAYRTPPQMERKAAQELREAGIPAFVPTERVKYGKGTRRVPVAPGYVFAETKPIVPGVRHEPVRDHRGEIIGLHERPSADVGCKYVKENKGAAPRSEVRRLYIRTSKTIRRHAFKTGDHVIRRGKSADVPAQIVRVLRVGWYEIAVEMMGKRCLVKIQESDLAAVHPPT